MIYLSHSQIAFPNIWMVIGFFKPIKLSKYLPIETGYDQKNWT